MEKISKKELKSWLDRKADFLLLDVMPPEYYGEKHITGAFNAPVYEVIFLEYVEKLTTDKDRKIVVYGANVNSLAAEDAAMKLLKTGYINVSQFSEGLIRWEQAGYSVEAGPAVPRPVIVDGAYEIDRHKSVVSWTGRNIKYAHRGTIDVQAGRIIFEKGVVTSGEIVLDMATIKDLDLTDDKLRGVLEQHLKSSDFFDVDSYPQTSFSITRGQKVDNATAGTPNQLIFGNMTIKDVTQPIKFSVAIEPGEGGSINGHAHFDIDRTQWNVRYGSEKFFENLEMHLVNDIISLDIFLVFR